MDEVIFTPELPSNRMKLDEKRTNMMRNSSNKKRSDRKGNSTPPSSGLHSEPEEVMQVEEINPKLVVQKRIPGT